MGGLTLPPSSIPNMHIMKKMEVKFRDRSAEPILLPNMKNQEDYALIIQRPPKETPIAEGTGTAALFLREGAPQTPECDLSTMAKPLHTILVMTNGWLLVGTTKRPSKRAFMTIGGATGASVHEFSITDREEWTEFVRKMVDAARTLGDKEVDLVRYVRTREHQTRIAAINYWKNVDVPWGEAMREAWTRDMSLLWTVMMQSNTFGVRLNLPGITNTESAPEVPSGYTRDRSRSRRRGGQRPLAIQDEGASTASSGGPRRTYWRRPDSN